MSVASPVLGTPARPGSAAYAVRDRWIDAGYLSIWQRSDGRITPSKTPMTAGDNVRLGTIEGRRMSAKRIDLGSKRESIGPIADAIRAGQSFDCPAPPSPVTNAEAPAEYQYQALLGVSHVRRRDIVVRLC